MIKYIDLKVDMGSVTQESLEKAFSLYDSQSTEFNKLFKKSEMLDKVKEVVRKRLISARAKYQGLTKELVDGFVLFETKSGRGKTLRKEFELTHAWEINKTKLQRRGNSEAVPKMRIYQVLDTGRRKYENPRKNRFAMIKSPMRFFWDRVGKWITFQWKGPRGGRRRFLTFNPNNKHIFDYKIGAKFTDRAFIVMEQYIDDEFSKMV